MNKIKESFLNAILDSERKNLDINDNDKNFCEVLIAKFNIASSLKFDADEDANYITNKLEEFIRERLYSRNINNKDIFILDEYFNLNNDYYENLKDYFETCSNPQKVDFSDFKWIKPFLDYINSQLRIYNTIATVTVERAVEPSQNLLHQVKSENKKFKDFSTAQKKELKRIGKDLDNKSQTINKNAENIIPNMITTLGIFVSIIIAVVAVYLSDLISVQNKNQTFNFIQEIAGSGAVQVYLGKHILSAHMLGNILFLLIFLVSRLTDRNILLSCNNYDKDKSILYDGRELYPCANCKKKCSFLKRIYKKIPYMIFYNVFLILLYIALFIWYFIAN